MANPKNQAPAAKPVKSNLVAVEKDGETIKISPLTLDNHLALGWKPVPGKAPKVVEADDAPDGGDDAPPADDNP